MTTGIGECIVAETTKCVVSEAIKCGVVGLASTPLGIITGTISVVLVASQLLSESNQSNQKNHQTDEDD